MTWPVARGKCIYFYIQIRVHTLGHCMLWLDSWLLQLLKHIHHHLLVQGKGACIDTHLHSGHSVAAHSGLLYLIALVLTPQRYCGFNHSADFGVQTHLSKPDTEVFCSGSYSLEPISEPDTRSNLGHRPLITIYRNSGV